MKKIAEDTLTTNRERNIFSLLSAAIQSLDFLNHYTIRGKLDMKEDKGKGKRNRGRVKEKTHGHLHR